MGSRGVLRCIESVDGFDGWGHVLSLGGLGAMCSTSRGEEEEG